MKKVLVMSLFALSTVFAACGGDDARAKEFCEAANECMGTTTDCEASGESDADAATTCESEAEAYTDCVYDNATCYIAVEADEDNGIEEVKAYGVEGDECNSQLEAFTTCSNPS